MVERNAVVTGAGGQIGAALVTQLLDRGMSVVALGRDRERLHEVGAHPRVRVVLWDQGVGAEPPGELGELSRVDALVHVAGVAPVTPVATTTAAEFTRLMSVNVVSAGASRRPCSRRSGRPGATSSSSTAPRACAVCRGGRDIWAASPPCVTSPTRCGARSP